MNKPIVFADNCHVKVQLVSIHDYPIHNHNDFQLYYVLEGELSMKVFYSTYRLQPGSIHLLHYQDIHSIKSISEDNLVLLFSFDGDYFQSVFPDLKNTVLSTNVRDESTKNIDLLRNQLFAIVSEAYNHEPGFEGRMDNAAVVLINNLIRNFRGFAIDPQDKEYVNKTVHDYMQVDRISRIVQYIYENYPYKIRLTDIAEHEGISAYYLSHVFQKFVGLNFRDFLSMVRIEKSEALVLDSDKSISAIAQDVGFSDAKYFTQNFYEYFNCHPKEFRHIYQHQIYRKKGGRYIEHPLSKLKPIVSRYTQYPVFNTLPSIETLIEIDFQRKPIGTLPEVGDNIYVIKRLLENAPMTMPVSSDISSLYKDVVSQEVVIEMLKSLVKDPTHFVMPSFSFFDSVNSLNGLLTINGLKKPIYYMCHIMNNLSKTILFYSQYYIVVQDDTMTSLVLFNSSKENVLTTNIVARNITGMHKLTKYHLRSNHSCLVFWSQLNFQQRLTERDIDNINIMSYPDVSYSVLPDNTLHYTPLELAPYDVVCLNYERVDTDISQTITRELSANQK